MKRTMTKDNESRMLAGCTPALERKMTSRLPAQRKGKMIRPGTGGDAVLGLSVAKWEDFAPGVLWTPAGR